MASHSEHLYQCPLVSDFRTEKLWAASCVAEQLLLEHLRWCCESSNLYQLPQLWLLVGEMGSVFHAPHALQRIVLEPGVTHVAGTVVSVEVSWWGQVSNPPVQPSAAPARGTRLIIMISASTAAGSCFFQSFLIKSPSMMSDLLPFGYIIFLSITYSKALSKS